MPLRLSTGLACAVIAVSPLTMAVPAASQAAPAPAEAKPVAASAPSGKALVRIDGGKAFAKKMDNHAYRLALPGGANILWLGEVAGRGLDVGTFTDAALVKGWQRLGHRPGASVPATLTWKTKGEKFPTALQVRVSNPRVASDGTLVFTARTVGSGQVIPAKLADFSLNITRGQEATPRGYPIYFGIQSISENVYVGVSAGGDYSSSVALGTAAGPWVTTNDPVNWIDCPSTGSGGQPVNPQSLSGSKRTNIYWGPFTCGGVNFGASYNSDIKTNYSWLPADPDRVNSSSQVQFYSSIVGASGRAFPISWVIATWGQGGKSPSPLPPAPPTS
jgi:hypothetical protein